LFNSDGVKAATNGYEAAMENEASSGTETMITSAQGCYASRSLHARFHRPKEPLISIRQLAARVGVSKATVETLLELLP